MMDVEQNKAIVRRFVEEVLQAGDLTAVDRLVSARFVPHTWPSTGDGRADLRRAIERVSGSLTDVSFTVDDMIGEGDQVAVRLTASATQTGELMGMAPTGKRYTIPEIHIFRLSDGVIAEHWHQFDQLALTRQLGALPATSAT
jgi:predicted ester cyclase